VAFAEPVTSKFNLSIGGFVKLDYAYNSENFGPSGGLLPGTGIIPKSSSPAGKQEQSIFTARQSRLWFKASGPDFMDAKTSALIEADFYGDPSAAGESPQMRMRLAYGALDWKNTQVLFGQNWDIFGPFIASTVDFRSGATTGAPNNPRVPQVRVTQKIDITKDNSLTLVAGLQDPNQDGNNNTQKNYGAAVNAAGQIMFSSKVLGAAPGYFGLPMKPLTVGVFGLYGSSKTTANVVAGTAQTAANQTVASYGGGVYAFVPVLKSSDGKSRAMTLSLEGQAYEAANMAFNTATYGTTVGTAADPKPGKGYGLGAQAIFYPTQELGLTAGYGKRGTITNSDYSAAGIQNFQTSNSELYANASYDLNAAVRVMAEYQNVETQYGNPVSGAAGTGLEGTANKGIANIFRVAVFYFF
jgi:hypothetical protein